jgi:hypothetical protein
MASVWTSRVLAVGAADPARSLQAALRAHRLAPFPGTQWQLGHARLATSDPSGAADLAAAVDANPQRFCALLLTWLPRAAPQVQTALEAQRGRCRGQAAP